MEQPPPNNISPILVFWHLKSGDGGYYLKGYYWSKYVKIENTLTDGLSFCIRASLQSALSFAVCSDSVLSTFVIFVMFLMLLFLSSAFPRCRAGVYYLGSQIGPGGYYVGWFLLFWGVFPVLPLPHQYRRSWDSEAMQKKDTMQMGGLKVTKRATYDDIPRRQTLSLNTGPRNFPTRQVSK